MDTIRDILAKKGRHLNTIAGHATIHTAAVLMNDHKIGSLLILERGQLDGILTERDVLEKVVACRLDPERVRVAEVMTREVICCKEQTSLVEARGLMKNCRVRHLPVLGAHGAVVGLVSIGDLNAHALADQEKTIHLLHEYIRGNA